MFSEISIAGTLRLPILSLAGDIRNFRVRLKQVTYRTWITPAKTALAQVCMMQRLRRATLRGLIRASAISAHPRSKLLVSRQL